jgi:RNA polymerase sigma factor (sigma-70 family)
MNVRKTQPRKKQNPAMKTINGRTYEQGGNLKRKEIISLLAERMAQLPELQKKVLAMYYYENMQLFKIAAIFGVTESRICQILGQAVTPLRDYLTELFA